MENAVEIADRLKVPRRYDLRTWDVIVFVQAAAFAALSLAYPDSGTVALFGRAIPRGWLTAAFSAAIALIPLLVPLVDMSGSPWFVRFLRTFYPQATTAFFFTEAIVLSTMVFGGFSHDPFFAGIDQAAFGFQPARVFSSSLWQHAWINELMFFSYFSYYVFLAVTPWIPWFTGRREEAERQLFAFALFSGFWDLFYVFFRVQGPKCWFDDLRELWYGHFDGGFFTQFFQGLFANATLSGAAFPSSHVSEMVMFTLFAARVDRRLLYLYVPFSTLVAAATVYLYAHYAVDILGGLAAGLLLAPLALKAQDPFQALVDRSVSGGWLARLLSGERRGQTAGRRG